MGTWCPQRGSVDSPRGWSAHPADPECGQDGHQRVGEGDARALAAAGRAAREEQTEGSAVTRPPDHRSAVSAGTERTASPLDLQLVVEGVHRVVVLNGDAVHL